MSYEVHVYICKKCLFTSEPNIGMKNECPDCKSALHFIRGIPDEVYARIKEIEFTHTLNKSV
jgi:hypothetical protein